MKVIDLIPGYIKHVIEDDNYVRYHNMYPELFNHYYLFWSEKHYHNTVYSKENILRQKEMIVAFLKGRFSSLIKFDERIRDMKIVLFVGDNVTNGHAFFDRGELIVWLPVEMYPHELAVEVFVTHELMHGLHYQASDGFYFSDPGEKNKFSRLLITEGMATYLSKQFTGKSNEQALWGGFINSQKYASWFKKCQESLGELRRYARQNYDTSDNGSEFFQANDGEDIYKYRAGYFLGLGLIEQMAITEDLTNTELLELPREEFERRIYQLL